MKVLKKKLKRANKFCVFLFRATQMIYIITLLLFIKNILNLKGIETLLRFILIGIFILWLLLYTITSLVKLIKKKYKLFIILTIISLLLSALFASGSYIIDLFYDNISSLKESNKIIYTSNLITLKDTEFNKNTSSIAMIEDKDAIEGYELANKLIKKYKLNNKINYYDNYENMLHDLYSKRIDAIFVSSNYKTLFSNIEGYENIGNDTKVIYKYSEELNNKDLLIASGKELTEPFTILVMGVDSENNGLNANAAFNGDTLIMVTFNPKTLTASMFSIPRDTYVPIACKNNTYSKINSSAAYGTSCVIDTVSNLTGITIDYYVKVNFKGVVDLVEALGGITVDIEEPNYNINQFTNCHGKICEQNSNREWWEHTIYINPGKNQHLNGEQALAYARCRHLYAESDIARNRHQQEVITAIAKEAMKINSFQEIKDILNAISTNMATNMSTEQILSSYQILKNMIEKGLKDEEMITIKKTYLQIYNLTVNTGRTNTSALGYYEGSLKAITDMMNENLGNKKVTPIKTFNYNANETYQIKQYGKGITTGSKLELLPNFIGKTTNEASIWAQNNNINITLEGTGKIITSQSLPSGYLVKNIKTLTIKAEQETTTTNEFENNDN